SQSYLMSCKSQAHDALGLIFAWEGVPPKMIVDGAKEMKLGELARKCKEASCYLRGTEPYSPWSTSAEREIRELKKGAVRKLTCSDGHVPETVVLGETADISPFCELCFWDWVKFREKGVAFSRDLMVLSKYLGPSIDVGSAMTQHDMKANELAVNTIAEALYAECDPDGIRWELCCEWKDGNTSWQKLSDLKESHPLQVADFALAVGIADVPAFNWWVSWVLKKRDRIISLVKCRSARYHKRTHKFGIELPKSVEEAYAIDKATVTTLWRDAIELGMKNVRVAFDVLLDGVAPPSDHQYMICHMIFDIKMEDLCRKARLVAGDT
ncbi:hypothetical protein ACHAW6_002756, partial [Cyclotella cf. meneghiniana]